MTNKEALETLSKMEACYNLDKCPPEGVDCTTCPHNVAGQEYLAAIELAKKAIAKQIPKQPVMGYAFAEKIREAIKRTDPKRAESKTECCPVCGRSLVVSQFVKAQTGLRVGDDYCKRCGQAIDWEE